MSPTPPQLNTRNVFFISLMLFAALLFFVPRAFIPSELGNTILTIVAFLFGIIAGFYIVVTTTDYNSVKNILASETAGWISLYQNVLVYDKNLAAKLSLLIDKYVRRAFDFEIIDYTQKTWTEFEEIAKLVGELPIKENLSSVYQVIREIMGDVSVARQQLTVLGAKTISVFQWAVLFTLAALFIFSLYGLRTGELFFDVVTVAISSSIVLMLLLIHDLDLYVWNERTFSFDIFENVFRSLGQLSYYPAESIERGRIHPREKEYRVGTYINFPKSSERKVETRGI